MLKALSEAEKLLTQNIQGPAPRAERVLSVAREVFWPLVRR